MKKQITLWLFSLWGIGGFLSAQTYLQKETTRLQNVKATEQAIADYISVNLPKYDLSSTSRQKLMSYTGEDGKIINLTTEQQQKAFLDAKRSKLRQMYFSQNPEKIVDFSATTIPAGSCFNGGFEETTAPTAGYTFRSDIFTYNIWRFGQNFPVTSLVSPTASPKVEVVSSGVDQYSGLSKVRSGKNAILLNKPLLTNGDYFGATSISKTFIVTEGRVSFSFALVLENPPGHGIGTSSTRQPYFQYRLLDKNRNEVFSRVIESNLNNPLFIRSVNNSGVICSPWVCATVDTSNYMNQEVTLEVITADCGQGAHFGYAYLDDFCGTSCTPYFGEVQLKFSPLNQNCPKLPLTVCANYVAPAGSTYKSSVLTILKQGVPVGTINAPAQITSKDLCFQVPASAFGVAPLKGDFEFKLDAVFTVPLTDGTLYSYNISTESANPGPDVSFNNCIDCTECCCPVHLNVTDNILSKYFSGKEASQTILAVNTVYPKGTLIMHGGKSVTLSPGFEAQKDSEVNVYIEGCTSLFKTARFITNPQVSNFGSLNDDIELIPVVATTTAPKITVSPNPTTGIINISFGETLTNRKVSIYNYSYNEVASKFISSGSSTTMDLTQLPSGIYMLSYISTNGNLVNFRIFR